MEWVYKLIKTYWVGDILAFSRQSTMDYDICLGTLQQIQDQERCGGLTIWDPPKKIIKSVGKLPGR